MRKEIERSGPRPILFHHMSVGGYLFGQWTRSLARDGALEPGSEHAPLLDCITAQAHPPALHLACISPASRLHLACISPASPPQIFDSPPDVNGIAEGAAKSMGIGGVRELPPPPNPN